MEHAGIAATTGSRPSLLLCATDAGGAQNLAAICGCAKDRGFEIHIITRRALAPLFSDSTIALIEELPGGIESFIQELQPRAIICGTTRYESPDRVALALARRDGMRCVAVVDEWYNYLMRFSSGDGTRSPVFPDAIAVPDEVARREAIAEGIPREICHATGSPSLALISGLSNAWQEFPPPVPAVLEGVADATIVTFLSETHSSDYGRSPGGSGPLGPYIGYTEQSVCQNILETLGRLPGQFVFVYRPHPSESDVAEPSQLPINIEFRMARAEPLHPLCYHSDLVLGMRSMAILEAALIGSRTASFQPGLIGPQVCTAVRIGLVPLLADALSLSRWIAANGSQHGRREILSQRPRFARSDAADNILRLATLQTLT